MWALETRRLVKIVALFDSNYTPALGPTVIASSRQALCRMAVRRSSVRHINKY